MKLKHHTLVTLLYLTVGATLSFSQTVLYRQGFHNSENETSTQFVPNEYNWESYYREDAVRVPGNRITYLTGGSAKPNVNAPTPYGDNLERGYWLMNVNVDQMAYTDLLIQRNADLVMGMELRNDSAAANWHFLLRFSGDEWYVSEEFYSFDSTDSFEWNLFHINAGGDSLWIPLNFEAKVQMGISNEPAKTLDSIPGDIVGAGFYGAVTSAVKRYRIDNFTVGLGEIFASTYFTHQLTMAVDGFKWNQLGWLDDSAYPYVYFFGLGGWTWVVPAGEEPESLFYLYSYEDEAWYWTGVDHYPMVYPVEG
jgi:hypothetical protein